ncbi:NAD-dependent epimerase/dehydratase family protein [Saccharopolyspora sp. CA-218241]|uniref:NAD-dependent epimerase/dehydratase family protein n=1 Tax=Saccharopolyspora sp. CA-218241 TaxID=3240027 RepID=UPI003D985F42
MPLRVVVAGASGVVGRTLLPLLRARGHHVTALVRRCPDRSCAEQADEVVTADVLDLAALREALTAAAPDVVVDQIAGFGPAGPHDAEAARRAADRRAATAGNLVVAAVAAGARRVVAQSTAAAYRPHGHEVLDEEAPLWTDAPGCWGDLVRSIASVEEAVLTCPGIEGVALRYGALYGPGTEFAPGGTVHEQVRGSALPVVGDGFGLTSFTHLDDAAGAVLEVLDDIDPGAYNVVDNEPAECAEWLPTYARMIGCPAPVSLTVEQAEAQLDWLTVHRLTEQRGATNFRLRETVGWRPAWPSWREGFAELLGHWPG